MTIADDPILRELSDANPATETDFDPAVAERILARATADIEALAGGGPHDRPRRPRRRLLGVRALVPAAGLLGVIAIVAVVVLAIHPGSGTTGSQTSNPTRGGSVTLRYRVLPTSEHPTVTHAVMQRTLAILRSRARSAGAARARVRAHGAHEIVVTLAGVRSVRDAELVIGSTAQLEFYDWESNALLPNGRSVASQLPLQNQRAMLISQGPSDGGGPGLQGGGGTSLYAAVRLASRQPAQTTNIMQLSRLGKLYYLFGAPGSKACATAAKDEGTVPVQGEHCYLAGLGGYSSLDQLKSAPLPTGVSFSEGQVLTVPQGWVVLQASNPTPSDTIKATSPQAQYFVLRDHPALSGKQISNPSEASQNGEPIVQFGFANGGAQAFQNVTRAIAQRGQQVSIGNRMLFQHFAVSVDGQLLTVPQINFEQYPDGVIATSGRPLRGSVQGSFTTTSARQLARQLRLGQLPVKLVLLDHRS
jgi:hypothetical protein